MSLIFFFLAICPGSIYAQDNVFDSSQPGYPNWSPFVDTHWDDQNERLLVVIDGNQQELVSIAGLAVSQMLEKCEAENWDPEKRLTGDLPQVLKLMGHDISGGTTVEVRDANGLATKFKNYRGSFGKLPFRSNQPGYPNTSLFSGMRWKEGRPEVQIGDDQWYELIAIQGLTVEEIEQRCRQRNWRYEKRLKEDHVQILRLMGKPVVGRGASLTLKNENGKVVKLADVSASVKKRHEILTTAVVFGIDVALRDIDFLEEQIPAQFAYAAANGVNLSDELEAVRTKLNGLNGSNLSQAWLAAELQKVMAKYIDGHARVSGFRDGFEQGYLPCVIQFSNGKYVAFDQKQTRFLDPDFQFIETIDERPIAAWLDVANVYVAQGSPQYRRKYGLRYLGYIQQMRKEIGFESSDKVKLGLANSTGQKKSVELQVSESLSRGKSSPRPLETGVMKKNNIAYLSLPMMDHHAAETVRKWMPKFKDTIGLIVDVRGNGGGTRESLIELAGYLITSEDKPRFGNVAKYRLYDGFRKDHLSSSRFIYRSSNPNFGERERVSIKEFLKTFKPEWVPPEDQFSQWHFMVFSKADDDRRFDYRKPVMILMDEGCFSATDIFLGAFKGWPNVTLVGQPSGGGSARTQRFTLPGSEIEIGCASMASFQPNGLLYDTNGVKPDVVVTRPPEYYIGGEDVILKKAVELIKEKSDK